MVTIGAHLFRTKSDLAAVTGTMDTHADLLLNPFAIAFAWCRPFTRFQGYPILCEENASLFFLDCVTLSGSRSEPCVRRFGVPDGLRDGGRNRGRWGGLFLDWLAGDIGRPNC